MNDETSDIPVKDEAGNVIGRVTEYEAHGDGTISYSMEITDEDCVAQLGGRILKVHRNWIG